MHKLQWLKDKRAAAKLTTYEVANKINMPQSTYSMIENGNRGATVDNAKKIAAFFGFEWTKFFE